MKCQICKPVYDAHRRSCPLYVNGIAGAIDEQIKRERWPLLAKLKDILREMYDRSTPVDPEDMWW